jgi:hypothetical protein
VNQSVSQVPPTNTTAPQDTSAQTFDSKSTYIIQTAASNGATWTTTFSIGSLVSGANMVNAASPALLASCNVNQTTDAIVPFLVTTASTTTGGFSADTPFAFYIANSALVTNMSNVAKSGTESTAGLGAGEQLSVALNYKNGPECNSEELNASAEGNPGQVNLQSTLQPGSSSQAEGFFYLANWKSPAFPNGDSGWLPNIWITIPYFGPSDDSQSLSVSGPNLVDTLPFQATGTYDNSKILGSNVGQYQGWSVPVDGVSRSK